MMMPTVPDGIEHDASGCSLVNPEAPIVGTGIERELFSDSRF